MRILWVTNGFPYPLTSGYLRHYFLMKELSRHNKITLLSYTGASFTAEHAAALEPFTERVLTFTTTTKSGLFRKAVDLTRSLIGTDSAVTEMCVAIQRLVSHERFDVALLCGKRNYPALKSLGSLPVVFDLCDAASMKIRGSIRYASFGRRFPQLIYYILMRRAEIILTREAEHLLFASYRDREALFGRRDNHSTVISNGVDLNFWKRSSGTRGTNTIVFTGVMSYSPNIDAALYLIDEILPLVRKSVHDAKLLIVGRNPPPRLIEAGRRRQVNVTGFVDDVRPYLEQATVFAAPLRFSAGIQNKILEAMAMEVPVVASPLAADGLCCPEGGPPPILVAEDRNEFAKLIIQQLKEGEEKKSPDSAARRFVERHFSWERSGESLEKVLEAVITTKEQQNDQRCFNEF